MKSVDSLFIYWHMGWKINTVYSWIWADSIISQTYNFPSKICLKLKTCIYAELKKKRNLAKYVKNKILPSRGKKKLAFKQYRQKSENVLYLSPLLMTSQWAPNEPSPHQCYLPVSFLQHAEELNFSPKWRLLIWEMKISQPYRETRGKKVKINLCKTWKYYIFPFRRKNTSRKEKRWNLGINDLL